MVFVGEENVWRGESQADAIPEARSTAMADSSSFVWKDEVDHARDRPGVPPPRLPVAPPSVGNPHRNLKHG